MSHLTAALRSFSVISYNNTVNVGRKIINQNKMHPFLKETSFSN